MANARLMDATTELAAGGGELVLGRYRLGARLGSGGFGTVFAARDERLGRPVAVKVIPAGAPAPERGAREALAAARLDHPGIVAVFDAGEEDDARYLVSELVEGRTLDRLEADGALSDRDVVRIGLTLADALAHARDRGVIHRDVKPQNVIVPHDRDDATAAAKLTDFGVAHLADGESLTRTGDVVGTLAYMAPEQAAGERIDDRADLYALALVLYEGLAGANPVRAGSPAATARRVGKPIPPLHSSRPDLPDELCAALDRALEIDPDDRGELEDLASVLEAELLEVSDDGGTLDPLPLERRAAPTIPRWALRAASGVAIGLLAGGAAAALDRPPASPLVVAAVAVAAALVWPRVTWIAGAIAAVVLIALEHPGLAVLIGVAAALPPLTAPRDGKLWPLPAVAPVLGLIGLAGAYPALAGRAHRAITRAGLGAAGAAWWLLATADGPRHWHDDAQAAFNDVLLPRASSSPAALVAVWAAGALVLPWLVRGRWLALDIALGTAWAAGLAAAAQALGMPDGAVAGGVAAGLLAVLLPRVLPRARDTVDGS